MNNETSKRFAVGPDGYTAKSVVYSVDFF